MSDYNFSFYSAVNKRIFPGSYVGKFLVIAFVCTHIPLICVTLAVVLTPGGIGLGAILLMLLLATLLGTLLAFYGFTQLLRPVGALGQALRDFLQRDRLPQFPEGFEDEVGLLLRDTERVLQQLQQRNRHLNESASHDHLTGLYNRRAAESSLNLLLQDQKVHCGRKSPIANHLVVGIADLDHFKRINDRYGHSCGDQALQFVAEFLKARMRTGDWVARWGGEEFLIVIQAPLEGARQAMDRVREELSEAAMVSDAGPIKLSISIGLAEVAGEQQLQSLVEAADRALYQAKAAGRDKVECA